MDETTKYYFKLVVLPGNDEFWENKPSIKEVAELVECQIEQITDMYMEVEFEKAVLVGKEWADGNV